MLQKDSDLHSCKLESVFVQRFPAIAEVEYSACIFESVGSRELRRMPLAEVHKLRHYGGMPVF